MGDNRPASLDSRFLGPVPEALLLGQVIGVFFRGEGLDWDQGDSVSMRVGRVSRCFQ